MAILQIEIKLTGLSPFFFVNNFSAKYEYSTFTCESTDIRALSAILKGVVDKRIETSFSQADLLKYITAGTEGSTGETGGVSGVDKDSILQSASQDAKTKADAAQAAAIQAAATDATQKANAAQASAIAAAASDAAQKVATVKQEAAEDAKTKADTAESNAIAQASQDASTKADAAKDAAILEAENKDNALKSALKEEIRAKSQAAETNAVATASTDATTKANQAKEDAIADAAQKDAVVKQEAATDASTKADKALEDAKAYSDTLVGEANGKITTIQASDELQNSRLTALESGGGGTGGSSTWSPPYKEYVARSHTKAELLAMNGGIVISNNALATVKFPHKFSVIPYVFVQQSIDDASPRVQYVNNITTTGFQYSTNYAGSQNGLRYVAYTFDGNNSAVTYGFN